jgi:hypothetical protein
MIDLTEHRLFNFTAHRRRDVRDSLRKRFRKEVTSHLAKLIILDDSSFFRKARTNVSQQLRKTPDVTADLASKILRVLVCQGLWNELRHLLAEQCDSPQLN